MKIEKTIDRESKLKLYVQIYTIIKEKIETGEWSIGIQIPTEDDLCKTYDVSKVTVREAIQELVREGYLKRQQGKGTFVLYSVPHLGLVMRTRLTDITDGEGVTVRKEMIEKGLREPPDEVKSLLQTQDQVHYFLCKRYISGDLSLLEEIFCPPATSPDVDDGDILYKSFFDVIEEKGTKKVFRVMQSFNATELKKDMAIHLDTKEGACAMMVTRAFFSSDGSPIACSRCVLSVGNKITMEFERIK